MAAADVRVLSRAIVAFYRGKGTELLNGYTSTALKRIWKAQRFSWWMTSMLHRFPGVDDFQNRV